MTVRHEFGGLREAGDIVGALRFPRLGLWDSPLMRHFASNVDFGALFGGTVGLDPFEPSLGVPIQKQVSV